MPPRIASLLPAATEILFALGLGDRVAAVSHECDWPPEARRLPRATFAHVDSSAASVAIDDEVRRRAEAGQPLYGIDEELLAAAAPGLIVTQAQCDVCAVRLADVERIVSRREELRGSEILPLHPASLGDVLADIARVGRAAGVPEAADRLVASLRGRIAEVGRRTAALSAARRPRVACVEWIEPLMLAGNWMPELVELAGGRCELTPPGRQSAYIGWPDVAAYDPQVVVVAPCGFDLPRARSEAPRLFDLPGWGETSAARNGRTWCADGNAYFNRGGPRLVDTIELLAAILHPDLFPAPSAARAERIGPSSIR
jgi:iron complex transport system substrate-binding protein